MDNILFKIVNLSKSFFHEQIKIEVLKNVSFSLEKEGLVLISGHSGSGKSTLLNLLASFLKADEGEIYFKNENLFLMNEKKLRRYRNTQLGFVFQNYNLFLEHNVLFNLALPLLINSYGINYSYEQALVLLRNYKLEYLAYQKAKFLSGGEKQRVAILRALINNPDVVFADEPTGALDEENAYEILHFLKDISKKRLVVIVSHDLDLLKQFATKHLSCLNGKLLIQNDV